MIPGIVVSLCLRYDFIKHLSITKMEEMLKQEAKGDKNVNTAKYMHDVASTCDKHYFIAVNFGYFIAIISTIVVMLIFDHG